MWYYCKLLLLVIDIFYYFMALFLYLRILWRFRIVFFLFDRIAVGE